MLGVQRAEEETLEEGDVELGGTGAGGGDDGAHWRGRLFTSEEDNGSCESEEYNSH